MTALGYEEPTPVQREAIPVLLSGRDVLGQAATGTGKTAAFALPMLQRIAEDGQERGRTSGLVLVPTRELAMQVAEAIHKYAKGVGLSVVPLYGGAAMDQQIRALKRGAEVVVATPGRALDHIRRRTLQARRRPHRGAGRGRRDARHGLRRGPRGDPPGDAGERQTVLFSATMPSRIAAIAQRHLREPRAPHHRAREARGGQAAAGAAGRLHRPARAQAAGPRAACWTWRTRPRPSCSAARASRWTSSWRP